MRTVYSKDNCPGCTRLLFEYEVQGYVENQDYVIVKVGKDISVEEFLAKFPGVRGVPHVVYE